MRLHITYDDPAGDNSGVWFTNYFAERAAACRFQVHTWAGDPAAADAILLLARGDAYGVSLRRHPLVRGGDPRVFVYDVADRPIPFLPGLYASLPRRQFDPTRHAAAGYLAPINPSVPAVAGGPPVEPDLLFSFVGAANAPVRRRLLKLGWEKRADAVVAVRLGWANRGDAAAEREYAVVLARSRFVLCPRGIGTATFRLFEAMELGRVPVILSDEWVSPAGPDWDSFSLRVPERRAAEVPRLLEGLADRAAAMGRAARAAWEEWFAPDVQFHRTAEAVKTLLDGGRAHRRLGRWAWPLRAAARRAYDATRRAARAAALRVLRAKGHTDAVIPTTRNPSPE